MRRKLNGDDVDQCTQRHDVNRSGGENYYHFSCILGPRYDAPTTAKSSGFSISWSHAWLSLSSSGTDTPSTENSHNTSTYNQNTHWCWKQNYLSQWSRDCRIAQFFLWYLWNGKMGSRGSIGSGDHRDQNMGDRAHQAPHMPSLLWSNACCLHQLDKGSKCCKEL